MSVKSDYDVGDVIFLNDEIRLYNYSKTKDPLNIISYVHGINIYESLENNTLQADLEITEGVELLNNWPVVGEEWIEFSILTPGRKVCHYNFFVESVLNVRTNDMGNLKSYRLRCVTEDFLKNSSMLFTKRYMDLDYDQAVKQVISQDLKSNKSIEVEPTKGKFDFLVNRVRPLQVIDLLTERAVSKRNKSSNFIFYEDHDAYRFVTLEYLIENRKSKANELFVFYHDTVNQNSPVEKVINSRNILSYQQIEQGSSVDKVKNGSIRNQFREFDISTGSYVFKTEYNNISDHTHFKSIEFPNDMNSCSYNIDQSKYPAVSNMVIKDGLRPEMEHNKTLCYKRAYFDRYMQQGLNIRVYGDTLLLVGDVVKISIPEISSIDVDRQQKYNSGNYLVRQIRHIISRDKNNRMKHFMILDLRKPGMRKAIS